MKGKGQRIFIAATAAGAISEGGDGGGGRRTGKDRQSMRTKPWAIRSALAAL